jgi:hypothetical protein
MTWFGVWDGEWDGLWHGGSDPIGQAGAPGPLPSIGLLLAPTAYRLSAEAGSFVLSGQPAALIDDVGPIPPLPATGGGSLPRKKRKPAAVADDVTQTNNIGVMIAVGAF